MAALPRLSPGVEHWVLRFACGLPAPLQRLLAGRPPRVEGQELASDVQMLLRLAALSGEESVTAEATPTQARARNRAAARAAAGPPRPLARVEDISIPGPTGAIASRLYAAAAAPSGAIVYYHGGGWTIGDLDTHDGVCRFLAANTAALVISVGYRLAPEHPFPAAVEDALAAFRWAAEEAPRLGADPTRVAIAGDSAGGNLAAAVSLLAREGDGPRPAMQALLYPITDVAARHPSRERFARGFLLTAADMDWFERHYLPPGAERGDPLVSVLHCEDLTGLPPAYVATAGFDPLRDEGEAYARRLREAGVRVALRRHPGLIHGFANMTAVCPSARAAMHELAGALRLGLS